MLSSRMRFANRNSFSLTGTEDEACETDGVSCDETRLLTGAGSGAGEPQEHRRNKIAAADAKNVVFRSFFIVSPPNGDLGFRRNRLLTGT